MEVITNSSYLQCEELYSSSLRADYLHKLLKFCLGYLSLLHLLFFISLFMACSCRFLFYTLGYNPALYYSFSQIVGHWALFHWLSMPLPLWHIAIIVFLFFTVLLKHCLCFLTTRYSRLIFYISHPRHRFSHFSTKLCSFLFENWLESKIRVVGALMSPRPPCL